MIEEKKKYILMGGGFILLAIIFFSYSPILTWDSSHYLWLTDLLSPNDAFSNWAMVCGFVFSLIIYISNILFGQDADGILMLMFIAYLLMLGFSYLIFKNTNKEMKIYEKNKKGIIFIITILLLIVFNPIIFGYYHTLLTEFIAITLAIITCYLSWQWIQFDFKNNKVKYIIYTIIFGFTTVFAWHLKQPYVTTGLFPIIIAAIISIIRKFNWKNILQRLSTVIFCFFMLLVSLMVWNKILEIGNVEIKNDKKASGFINNGIINGISQLKETTTKEDVDLEAVEDAKISQKEKEEIQKILNTDSKYKDFILYKNENSNSKDMVLFLKGENISLLDSVKFFIKTTFSTPTTIIKSYCIGYLSMIDVFHITFEGVAPIPSTDLNVFGTAEHEAIAFRTYNTSLSNTFYVKESLAKYQEPYQDTREPIQLVNAIMKSLETFIVLVTKLAFLILPIILIITIIKSIKQRKHTNSRKNNIYNLLIILLSFSFLHVFIHVILDAPIDRYTTPAMLPMFIAYIIIVFSGIYRKEEKN